MEQPDEKMYELEINLCDDGDILIEQGRCWSCDEMCLSGCIVHKYR